jgi:hypothetical protein
VIFLMPKSKKEATPLQNRFRSISSKWNVNKRKTKAFELYKEGWSYRELRYSFHLNLRQLNCLIKQNNGIIHGQGYPTLFNSEEESEFFEEICTKIKEGKLLKDFDLKEMGRLFLIAKRKIFRLDPLSNSWLRNFKKKYPSLRKRRLQNQSEKRQQAENSTDIKGWKQKLSDFIQQKIFSYCDIWNYDETGLIWDTGAME